MEISGKLYKLIKSYLNDRFQRVVLNGQTSSWRPIIASISQGTILGPPIVLMTCLLKIIDI